MTDMVEYCIAARRKSKTDEAGILELLRGYRDIIHTMDKVTAEREFEESIRLWGTNTILYKIVSEVEVRNNSIELYHIAIRTDGVRFDVSNRCDVRGHIDEITYEANKAIVEKNLEVAIKLHGTDNVRLLKVVPTEVRIRVTIQE